MLDVAVLGGIMAKLHVYLYKIHAEIGTNMCFGMHFTRLRQQT
jgi:hypothetical protein